MKAAIGGQPSAFSPEPGLAKCRVRPAHHPFSQKPPDAAVPYSRDGSRASHMSVSMRPTIAIIGGNGQMGRWFTALL